MNRLTLRAFLLVSCILGAHSSVEGCENPIIIDSVEIQKLIATYTALKQCIQEQGSVTAYVYGVGGSLREALAFFDLVRTTPDMAGKTTFIASGLIASASNIVWFAAGTRVALPGGSSFLVHPATWNMDDESTLAREQNASQIISAIGAAARLAAGEAAATLLMAITEGNSQGQILDAQKALALGWATEIRQYSP